MNVLRPDFGLRPTELDGSTDLATKIQSAIDWADRHGPRRLYFPPGRYGLGARLTLPDDMELLGASRFSVTLCRIGDGVGRTRGRAGEGADERVRARIDDRFPPWAGDLVGAAASVSGVTLREITLDHGDAPGGRYPFTLPNGSSDVEVDGCRFVNLAGCGSAVRAETGSLLNSGWHLHHCAFIAHGTHANRISIEPYNADYLTVESCLFDGWGGISANTGTGESIARRVIRVLGCDFVRIDATCINIRASAPILTQGVEVLGNNFWAVDASGNRKAAIAVGEQVAGSGAVYDNVTIEGNDIHAVSPTGSGIKVGDGGGRAGRIANVRIAANGFDGRDASGSVSGSATNYGIWIQDGCTGVAVESNTVRGCGREGILVTGSTLVDIADNSVEHAVQSADPAWDRRAGVQIQQGATEVTVQRNRVSNCGGASPTSQVAGIGVAREPAIRGVTIVDNECWDDRDEPHMVYGIRIGTAGADSLQPEEVTVRGNEVGRVVSEGVKVF